MNEQVVRWIIPAEERRSKGTEVPYRYLPLVAASFLCLAHLFLCADAIRCSGCTRSTWPRGDVFRILGAMDRLDRREGSEQLEPVISRGWAALEELPKRRQLLTLSPEDALLFESALYRLRARLRYLVRVN